MNKPSVNGLVSNVIAICFSLLLAVTLILPSGLAQTVHDVAVSNVFSGKTVVCQGFTATINVTVVNKGDSPENFNVTLSRLGETKTYTLVGFMITGWNSSIPAPAINVNLWDTVSLTLSSGDGGTHNFFVDYNGNKLPSVGEPISPTITAGSIIHYSLVASTAGAFTYYCQFHPTPMNGPFTTNATSIATSIGAQVVNPSLPPAESRTLSFTWNSIGMPKGNYTLRAVADTVAGETSVADNTFIGGFIVVSMPGDVTPDGTIDIFDVVPIALAFGATSTSPNWNFNADINNDGIVDIFDIVVVALHFGQVDP